MNMTARYSDRDGATWPNTSIESADRFGVDGIESRGPDKLRNLNLENSFIRTSGAGDGAPSKVLATPFRNDEIITKSIEFHQSHHNSTSTKWVDYNSAA